jgi:ATP-binding cassette subfamily B protein
MKNKGREKNILGRAFIKRNVKFLLIPILFIGIYSLIQLILPIIIGNFIDGLTNSEYIKKLMQLVIVYAVLSVALFIANMCKGYYGEKSAWFITDRIRIEMLEKNVSRGQTFYNCYTPGDVLEIMENDIEIIESFIIDTCIPVMVDILILFGIYIYFFYKSVVIGACFFVFSMFIFALIYIIQKKESDCITEERKQSTKLTSFWSEVISLRKEINVMGSKSAIIDKIEILMQELKKRIVSKQIYLYRVWTCTLLALVIINVFSFTLGGYFYFKRYISFGTVYLMYSFSNMLRDPMEKMQMYIQNCLIAKESIKRISNMLSFEDKISSGEVSIEDLNHILVKDVSHKFNEKLVLENISFEICENEKIGIFGDSGSGKSTLCKILCKLYEIQEGEIKLNKHNIQDIDINSLRNTFAYVTASEQVYSSSLKDNLDMFSQKPIAEIANRIDKYNLRKFLKILKDDDIYQKLQEELDVELLSIGERQLINIMRLFFCDKKIIIYDEAAANIDENIENEYFELLEKIIKSHMAIIVTHNVERLSKCDKIIAMRNGSIIESGYREELQNDRKSLYYKYSQRK